MKNSSVAFYLLCGRVELFFKWECDKNDLFSALKNDAFNDNISIESCTKK